MSMGVGFKSFRGETQDLSHHSKIFVSLFATLRALRLSPIVWHGAQKKALSPRVYVQRGGLGFEAAMGPNDVKKSGRSH